MELSGIPDLGEGLAQLGLLVLGLRFAACFSIVFHFSAKDVEYGSLYESREWDIMSRWKGPPAHPKRGAKKYKKAEPMLAASFSRTPLLEEMERRTGLLGPPYLPRRLPDQSQSSHIMAGFLIFTLP